MFTFTAYSVAVDDSIRRRQIKWIVASDQGRQRSSQGIPIIGKGDNGSVLKEMNRVEIERCHMYVGCVDRLLLEQRCCQRQ